MSSYVQDPDDKLDYQIDWTTFLTDGETVSSYTLTSSDAAFVISGDSEASGVVTYWVTGGTDGSNYKVTCHIVTSAGREKDATDTFLVRQR